MTVFVKVVELELREGDERDLQQPDHGQVVGPVDRVDTGDRHAVDFAPQQAAHRHGAGDGIRVRRYNDQHPVGA